MGFTNSPLVSYTKISPNKNVNRNHEIDTITIHCVVGQLSVETIGHIFEPVERQASCNYGVGYDGRIGMYVEEKDRSWCTSSRSNDHRAITIEVACDLKHPYTVNPTAYAALIELVADICKRNNIKELKWVDDKSLIGQVDKQNMTIHRWFANTSCPGEYLYTHMGDIAEKVNKKLGVVSKPANNSSTQAVIKNDVNVGDYVKIASDAVYSTGKIVPNWVKNRTWIVDRVNGDVVIVNKDTDPNSKTEINSPIDVKYLTVVDAPAAPAAKPEAKEPSFKPYMVKVTASSLNVRSGPGTNYSVNTTIRDRGCYTIVAEANETWGKLKSGAGWISLNYTKKI